MKRWANFWFAPEEPLNLIAARILIALDTLWILLSRPRLPDLLRWPAGFWSHVDHRLLDRFLFLPIDVTIEWMLFLAMLVALVAALFGVATRASCLIAGLLLYHFAPLEDILSSDGGPFFRGLGFPVMALLILAFAAQPRRRNSASPEYRWPLALIRLLFAFTYLFSGIAKVLVPGIREWVTPSNFQLLVAALSTPDVTMPWAHYFAEHRMLAGVAAAGVITLDLFLISAVFSRRAAWIVVPIAFAMHILAPRIIGVVFFNAPLLLLFVDWNAVYRKIRDRRDFRSTSTNPSTQ